MLNTILKDKSLSIQARKPRINFFTSNVRESIRMSFFDDKFIRVTGGTSLYGRKFIPTLPKGHKPVKVTVSSYNSITHMDKSIVADHEKLIER